MRGFAFGLSFWSSQHAGNSGTEGPPEGYQYVLVLNPVTGNLENLTARNPETGNYEPVIMRVAA